MINGFVISPDGVHAFAATNGYIEGAANLLAIDLPTLTVLKSLQIAPASDEPYISNLAMSPDGTTLYFGTIGSENGQANNTLYAVDTASLTVLRSATDFDWRDLSTTPDGSYLYSQVPPTERLGRSSSPR